VSELFEAPRKIEPSSAYGIKVEGVSDVMLRMAKCCSPVPGDPIVGYIREIHLRTEQLRRSRRRLPSPLTEQLRRSMRSCDAPPMPDEPIRILRVIARLNVGGPAIQAISLTQLLGDSGYETLLVRGVEGPTEGNMDYLAERLGVKPLRLRSLRRRIGVHDLASVVAIRRLIQEFRPHILHTHAAKAGTAGRLAAMVSGSHKPPVIVHTFHGHVLSDYFSGPLTAIFRGIESFLARRSSALVAVSQEVKDDLVSLGIASAGDVRVVPLGFDLAPFALNYPDRAAARQALRRELGIEPAARVVTLVARLVPVKRVDRFLRIVSRLSDLSNVSFLIVGDGELGPELKASRAARALGDRVVWTGLRRDMPGVYAASDVVALCSDNEGTPVSLIEAQAAGLPVVTTRVGGVATVVESGGTGFVVDRDDEEAFASALRTLITDEETAVKFGAAGANHVTDRFRIERLVSDIDDLYRSLLPIHCGRLSRSS